MSMTLIRPIIYLLAGLLFLIYWLSHTWYFVMDIIFIITIVFNFTFGFIFLKKWLKGRKR
jgi:hypothetical protein